MDEQLDVPLLPPSPVTPGMGQQPQRTIQLHRGAGAKAAPWTAKAEDKAGGKAVPWTDKTHAGTQRLRLPKRRTMSTGRSSTSSYTVVEEPAFGDIPEDSVSIDVRQHVRGTRSMSAVRSSIALGAARRASLSRRLSQSQNHGTTARGATSPTLPIATRPRFNSAMSAFGVPAAQTGGFSGTELTIRLSVDASQSRSYRMLLEGDSVLADLRHLEDEYQCAVSAAQAGLGRRLIALYFAASWSADCDDFTPQLLGVAAAHSDDLAVVLVSLDHHPADMARIMDGSGWLCVPWREHARRCSLAERMEVSPTDMPKLVIIDGHSHHVISATARADLERRPLTCVREWKKSRAGLSWWNKAKPWAMASLATLVLWYLALFMLVPAYMG